MICQILFSGKNKKSVIDLSSAKNLIETAKHEAKHQAKKDLSINKCYFPYFFLFPAKRTFHADCLLSNPVFWGK